MKVVTTFHPSSSVVSSVKCRLASRDLEHLVCAKLDRIDVYSIRSHGLQHECGVDVWGKVLCVRAITLSGTERSKLVLMTSHPNPELVFFSYKENEAGSAELLANKSLSLYERSPRQAEFCNDLLIHHSGTLAIASCYVGKLKVIKLDAGEYVEDFDFSIPELSILSIAFLPTDNYGIAILHLDYQSRVQLISREVPESLDSDTSTLPSTLLHPTAIAKKVIPFPTESVPKLIPVSSNEGDDGDEGNFLGGVLVVGGRKILLYELASEESRTKQRGKAARLEKMKTDPDPAKSKQAKAKQAERGGRRRKATAVVEWPWGEVTAWSQLHETSPCFMIGEVSGGLALISLKNVKGAGMILVPLGMTSPATTLAYLTNQVLFVGSHLGDSQVIHVAPTPSYSDAPLLPVPPEIPTVSRNNLHTSSSKGKGKGRATEDDMDVDDCDDAEESSLKGRIVASEASYLKIVDSFKNIGPINDAVIVGVEGTGQNEIVTCSGGSSTGALNVIRSGSEFKEAATVPGICNVNNLWTIKTNFEDSTHSHVIACTHDRTLAFKLNDNGTKPSFSYLDSQAARDLITNVPTIALSNVRKRLKDGRKMKYTNSPWIVQITSDGVYLLGVDQVMGGYNQRARWAPPSSTLEIVVASINHTQIAVGLSGGKLVILRFDEGGTAFELMAEKDTYNEISAVSCEAMDPDTPYARFFTVGYWGSCSGADDTAVEIFELERKSTPGYGGLLGLVSAAKVSRSLVPALPRSLFLHDFGAGEDPKLDPAKGPAAKASAEEAKNSYLICGLADGSVVHFVWRDGKIGDSKIVSLGYAPVRLRTFEDGGKRRVFACGSRAAVFVYKKNRLTHSPIMLKDLSAASPLNTPTFPDSFVLANGQGLSIGTVEKLGKLSIRSYPFSKYETPLRIVHVPLYRAFAVACTAWEPVRVGDGEIWKSTLKLMDDSSFEVISQFNCNPDELVSSVAMFTRVVEGKETAFIVVGTSSSNQARLVVFTSVSSQTKRLNRDLALVTSEKVNGPSVNAIKVVDDHIVAAVHSAVVSYKFVANDTGTFSFSLEKVGEWNHNYIVRSLESFNHHLAIADLASSVSIVKLSTDDGKISAVARDYTALYPFALEALSEDAIIGGTDSSDIFTFSVQDGGGNKKVLEKDGSFFLGDLATKFIRGAISSDFTPSDIFHPNAVFFTSCGKIGAIIDVKDRELGLNLTELQRNLSAQVQGVGAPSHTRFRAPHTKRNHNDSDAAGFGFIDGDFVESFLGILGDRKKVEKVLAGKTEPERLRLSEGEFRTVLETLQQLH